MKIKQLFDSSKEWDRKPNISDETTVTSDTWSSKKISTEVSNINVDGYNTLKSDVEKIKTELTTTRSEIITNFNSTIDIL